MNRIKVLNVVAVGFVTMYGMTLYKTKVKAITPNKNTLPVELLFLTEDEATKVKAGDQFVY